MWGRASGGPTQHGWEIGEEAQLLLEPSEGGRYIYIQSEGAVGVGVHENEAPSVDPTPPSELLLLFGCGLPGSDAGSDPFGAPRGPRSSSTSPAPLQPRRHAWGWGMGRAEALGAFFAEAQPAASIPVSRTALPPERPNTASRGCAPQRRQERLGRLRSYWKRRQRGKGWLSVHGESSGHRSVEVIQPPCGSRAAPTSSVLIQSISGGHRVVGSTREGPPRPPTRPHPAVPLTSSPRATPLWFRTPLGSVAAL